MEFQRIKVLHRYSKTDDLFSVLVSQRTDIPLLNNRKIESNSYLFDISKSKCFNKESLVKLYQDIEKIKISGRLIISTDYDTDGLTSNAVIHYILHKIFKIPKFEIINVNNYRAYGNGVNNQVVEQILKAVPNKKDPYLLLTADHGSHNLGQYKVLKEVLKELKIAVTDHHIIDQHENRDIMDYFFNPQVDEEGLWTKALSGCGVIFYTLLYAYYYGKKEEGVDIKEEEIMNLFKPMLAYVSLSLISDIMPLNTYENRVLTRLGFKEINTGNNHIWKLLFKVWNMTDMYDRPMPIDTHTLNFKFIPLINTGNRCDVVDDVCDTIKFIEKEEDESSGELKHKLLSLLSLYRKNNLRKADINNALSHAITIVKEHIVIALINSEYYVAGVVAARLRDKYDKPVFVFEIRDIHIDLNNTRDLETFLKIASNQVPLEKYTLAGSYRGYEDSPNIVNALTRLQSRYEDMLLNFGGHQAAAGAKIRVSYLKEFINELNEEMRKEQEQLSLTAQEIKELKVDTTLTLEDIKTRYKDILTSLLLLEPYGKKWDYPLFYMEGYLKFKQFDPTEFTNAKPSIFKDICLYLKDDTPFFLPFRFSFSYKSQSLNYLELNKLLASNTQDLKVHLIVKLTYDFKRYKSIAWHIINQEDFHIHPEEDIFVEVMYMERDERISLTPTDSKIHLEIAP